MARPLQVLSLLSRLGALTVFPSASVNSYRFASGGARKAWVGQSHAHRASKRRDDMYDEEPELEDVEDKLQALVDEGRKRQRAVKYHILRRQMTPSGPPPRKLTWDAMEQIRYLKQEQPEEWTVERLAEGFSVTPDVILRVLRSKFAPTPERKAKQEAKIMTGLRQQVLPSGAGTGQGRLKLPVNRTPAVLPPGSREGALMPVVDRTLMLRGVPVAALHPRLSGGTSEDSLVTRSTEEDRTSHANPREEEDEERWDGQVLTDGELEELMETKKLSPVVQVGKDFFDAEGNFLYRI